jgi:phosphoglycerate dehydrogenase-like enzyme
VPTLTIFCNVDLSEAARALLVRGTEAHRLVAPDRLGSTYERGQPDALLAEADIAFGQPDVEQVIASSRLAWVHLASAGYTPYDRDDVREALRSRGAALTKSSLVYEEACAEHLLAFMYAQARQLPAALAEQRGGRGWPQHDLRARSRLLRGQSTVIVGFGSIAQRLAELLAPLKMQIIALRRQPTGDESIRAVAADTREANVALGTADHIINTLPAAPSTHRFFDAARFAALKPGAIFYNIGRGTTVDQPALIDALTGGHLAAAYLDVTDPEPLPTNHPLWTTLNCFITPHTAGGHDNEPERLVELFLENLKRYSSGQALLDRVV